MNSPALEGLKEVGRWLALFAISWVITATLGQLANVPEFYTLNVWVFSYTLPVRLALNFGLTFIGRFVDKALFVKNRQDTEIENKGFIPTDIKEDKPTGLLPF